MAELARGWFLRTCSGCLLGSQTIFHFLLLQCTRLNLNWTVWEMFSLSTISIRICSIAIVSVAITAHSLYPQQSRHLSPPRTWRTLFWLKPPSPQTPASWKSPWWNQVQGYQPVFLAYGSARHKESMKMLGHVPPKQWVGWAEDQVWDQQKSQ